MKTLLINILAWLLHHANSLGRNSAFYAIKNKLLEKYGVFVRNDVQFIQGKQCFSCHGTGIYIAWDKYVGAYEIGCYKCYGGWYKRPHWNILKLYSIGNYTFHQPLDRVYEKPENSIQVIEGYIKHNPSQIGRFARIVLFLLFDKGYFKRIYKELGIDYRVKSLQYSLRGKVYDDLPF